MINIPGSNKRFIQPNNSDTEGILYATKGLDFDANVGNIQVGSRMLVNTSTTDQANLQSYPVAFRVFDDGGGVMQIYAACGKSEGGGNGAVYKGGSSPDVAFTEMTSGTVPNTIDSWTSDMELFNGELWVTGNGSNAWYRNTSATWTAIATGSSYNGYPRPLCKFGSRIYTVIDGYKIVSSSSGHDFTTGTFKTDIAQFASQAAVNEIITFLRVAQGKLWIGTTNIAGGRGRVIAWDGATDAETGKTNYYLESAGALSCVVHNDTPYIVDSNGDFRVFNSATFTKLTSFYKKNNKQFNSSVFTANRRFIHPNGMATINGKIHILVDLMNGETTNHTGTQDISNPSGVYVYDEATRSLRHKYPFGLTKSVDTITDYGAFRIARSGALMELPANEDYPANTLNGQMIAGISVYTDATNSKGAIYYDDTNDTLKKSGYFITPKIDAGADKLSILDTFQKAYIFHEPFLNASDKMVIKYRTVEDIPTEGAITWIDTTTFTCASDLSDYIVGDEVEILQGIGAGLCSHITMITPSDVGYIVQVDETHTGATGTARARFMKWKKAGVIQDVKSFDHVKIDKTGSWIQLKVFMLWTGKNEFAKMVIMNQPNMKMQ